MDDDDTPWKEVITQHFPDFMAFYFPDAHAAIDWSRPHDFLDQELAALSRDAVYGKRLLDKLVRVFLRGGVEQWVLVHLEIQAQHDAGFAERVFTYHYRVFDRYPRPVASLALLADDSPRWRPSLFAYDLLGCEMSLVFPIVKLQDYAHRLAQLLEHANPFALVTAAHVLTQNTRQQMHRRRQLKWRLTKLLYQRNWDRQRVIDLFRVIDWMMHLPPALDARLRNAVLQLERRRTMPYITSIERIGMEMGRQEGRQEGRAEGRAEILLEVLAARFGGLANTVQARVAVGSAEQLSAWARRAASATTLDEVFGD